MTEPRCLAECEMLPGGHKQHTLLSVPKLTRRWRHAQLQWGRGPGWVATE